MSTTQPTAKPPRSAADRAAERLDAWARQHPQAAALARLASLAVRVDASLLRRLRLQLLPRAEPGIEADLWFAGLHAAQGGGSLVFDPAVQQLLRTQLCQASAAPGQPRPLQAAWDITRGLHAAWPLAHIQAGYDNHAGQALGNGWLWDRRVGRRRVIVVIVVVIVVVVIVIIIIIVIRHRCGCRHRLCFRRWRRRWHRLLQGRRMDQRTAHPEERNHADQQKTGPITTNIARGE